MSAFKQLKSQDIIVSPLELNKGYEARTVPRTASNGGYDFIDYSFGIYGENPKDVPNFPNNLGIERYIGRAGYYTKDGNDTGYFSSYKETNIYHSIKQLYYTNYLSGSKDAFGKYVSSDANLPFTLPDGVVTGSEYNPIYDNYRQTDLVEGKFFPTQSTALIGVLSIPSGIYGDYIQPGSFRLSAPRYSGSGGGTLYDDGEGRILSGSNNVGNIVYTHGQVIMTNFSESGYHYQDYSVGPYGPNVGSEEYFFSFFSGSEATCSFSSSYTIYETQYKCTVGESEFNYTQNPSAISGSDGNPYGFVTSSFFTPYITTVGLYNDAFELLAVGKLAKPLPTSKFTDTTILVNIDRQ